MWILDVEEAEEVVVAGECKEPLNKLEAQERDAGIGGWGMMGWQHWQRRGRMIAVRRQAVRRSRHKQAEDMPVIWMKYK